MWGEPIETAPKDGRYVILGTDTGNITAVCYWQDGSWGPSTDYFTRWLPTPEYIRKELGEHPVKPRAKGSDFRSLFFNRRA